MNDWRQSWGGGSWRGGEYRASNNRRSTSTWRPPLPHDFVESAVPVWEKKYCTTMLRMPWKMLCVNQNYMVLCKNVMEWDDSGALEAFQNAKSRFYAEYNGAPCSIPLPDPDLYIDKVDYYGFVDPMMVADLDKEPPPPVHDVEFGGADSVIVREKLHVTATGWDEENDAGDCRQGDWDAYVEQPSQGAQWVDSVTPNSSGWDAKECSKEWGTGASGFGEADVKFVYNNTTWNSATTGWGAWGDTVGPGDSWSSGQDNRNDFGRYVEPCKNKSWELNRRYGRKRDGGGRTNGRYTKPKFNLGVYQPNNNWRNCVERNSSDSHYEKKDYPKQPLAW